jgi:hypothetical protein
MSLATKMHAISRKVAQITPEKITSDKRNISLDDSDYNALREMIEETKEFNSTGGVIVSHVKQTKAQKRKAKKKEKMSLLEQASKEFGDQIISSTSENAPTEIEQKPASNSSDNSTSVENPVENTQESQQKLPPRPLVSGYSVPIFDNGCLKWTKEDILPPVLKGIHDVVIGMFSTIKKEDICGCELTLYPPSEEKHITTFVTKAGTETAARLILVSGSCENLNFELAQGRTDASCDYPLFKDQCILIKFGYASTLAFSFNNDSSFIFKINPNARGIRREKQPKLRWVMVFDLISKKEVINREFKNAISAIKGENGSNPLMKRFNNITTDVDRVTALAEAKVKPDSKNTTECPSNNVHEPETTVNTFQEIQQLAHEIHSSQQENEE